MGAEPVQRRGAESAEVTEAVIAAAIEVHRELGPGMLESIYQNAMQMELAARGIAFEAQKPIPVLYKGQRLSNDLRLDLIVANEVIVEIKSVAAIQAVHAAQLLSYLRLTRLSVGLLLNFNAATLKQGIKRVSNSPGLSAASATLR